MKVYCIFNYHTDECTYGYDDLLGIYTDQKTANFIKDELNKFLRTDVIRVEEKEARELNFDDIQKEIDSIKKRVE
jgi:hypothetical protein